MSDCDDDPAIEELRLGIRAINALLSTDQLSDEDRLRLREDRRGLSEDLAALRRVA